MDGENFNKTFLAKQLVQAIRISDRNIKKSVSKMQEKGGISEDESKSMQESMNIRNCLSNLLSNDISTND